MWIVCFMYISPLLLHTNTKKFQTIYLVLNHYSDPRQEYKWLNLCLHRNIILQTKSKYYNQYYLHRKISLNLNTCGRLLFSTLLQSIAVIRILQYFTIFQSSESVIFFRWLKTPNVCYVKITIKYPQTVNCLPSFKNTKLNSE